MLDIIIVLIEKDNKTSPLLLESYLVHELTHARNPIHFCALEKNQKVVQKHFEFDPTLINNKSAFKSKAVRRNTNTWLPSKSGAIRYHEEGNAIEEILFEEAIAQRYAADYLAEFSTNEVILELQKNQLFKGISSLNDTVVIDFDNRLVPLPAKYFALTIDDGYSPSSLAAYLVDLILKVDPSLELEFTKAMKTDDFSQFGSILNTYSPGLYNYLNQMNYKKESQMREVINEFIIMFYYGREEKLFQGSDEEVQEFHNLMEVQRYGDKNRIKNLLEKTL